MILIALFGCEQVFAEEREAGTTTVTTVDFRYNDQAPVGYFEVLGVDGENHVAFCGWHEKKLPEKGWKMTTLDIYTAQNKKNENLRKVLWYGFDGPGNMGANYAQTALAASVALGHMDTDDTGETEDPIGKTFLASVKGMEAPPEEFQVYCVRNLEETEYKHQCLVYYIYNPNGELKVFKKSSDEEVVADNVCYSLKNAVYGVFSDEGCTDKIGEMTTDAAGNTNTLKVKAGIYYVKEIKAPEGYKLSETVKKVSVSSRKTTEVTFENEPYLFKADHIITKYDSETDDTGRVNTPQGAASLEGAEYKIDFYAEEFATIDDCEGKAPVRSWIMKTDAKGEIIFSEQALVEGDEFWKDSSGNKVLPLGTLIVQEIKASEGYFVNPEKMIRVLNVDTVNENGDVLQTLKSAEEVIKGNLKITKFHSKEGKHVPMEGIVFTLKSKTNGQEYKIMTDKHGEASTMELGGLPYDTYSVSEENTPEGYFACDSFEVIIDENGEVLSYIIENRAILSAVTIVKKDAETGKIIALSGTQFRILDVNQNPVSMHVTYPSNMKTEIFMTDENGMVTLPQELPCGSYYLEEVKAPEGYVKGEILEFQITEENSWGEPLLIEYVNKNALGQILLTKVGADNKKALAGAEFEIVAAEDIITADGTVRANAGEVVDILVTDKTGKAMSKELYLGEYMVKETKAPEGFVLSKEIYPVSLQYADQDTPLVIVDIGIIENYLPEVEEKKEIVLKTEEEETEVVKTGDVNKGTWYVVLLVLAFGTFMTVQRKKK